MKTISIISTSKSQNNTKSAQYLLEKWLAISLILHKDGLVTEVFLVVPLLVFHLEPLKLG